MSTRKTAKKGKLAILQTEPNSFQKLALAGKLNTTKLAIPDTVSAQLIAGVAEKLTAEANAQNTGTEQKQKKPKRRSLIIKRGEKEWLATNALDRALRELNFMHAGKTSVSRTNQISKIKGFGPNVSVDITAVKRLRAHAAGKIRAARLIEQMMKTRKLTPEMETNLRMAANKLYEDAGVKLKQKPKA